MAGQGRTLLILGGVLVAGIAAAIWAGMTTPPDGVLAAGAGAADPASPGGEPSRPVAPGVRGARRPGTAVVFGEIRRSAGRAPVAGQDVVLTPAEGAAWTATTDAHGAFRLDKMPHGGPYELSVTATGSGTIRLPGIRLGRDEQRNLGTLFLDPSVRLTLRVRDHRDEPVAGASIEAFPIAQYVDYDWSKALAQVGQVPIAVARTTTDAKGDAVLPEMAVGTWTFTARRDGYAPGGVRDVVLRSGEEVEPVTIHLWPGHPLDGRVLAPDGSPVAAALVLAGATNSEWDPDSAPLRARATADARGRYAFAALDSGPIQLWVARAGGVPSPAAVVRVPLVPHYDIVLEGSGTLTGVVTEKETGNPVDGAVVRASSWEDDVAKGGEAVTGADGSYSLEMSVGAINEITAEKEGLILVPPESGAGNQRQATLHEGQSVVRNLQMRHGTRLSGTVRGPDGPLFGVRVQVAVPTPDNGFTQRTATTSADGRYEFAAVEKGNHLVLAEKDGYWQAGAPEAWWDAARQPDAAPEFRVEIPESGSVTKDIELKGGVPVEGRVEGPDGAGLAGARVSTPGALGPALSGADGAFRIEGVKPAAEVAITCEKTGFTPAASRPVEVTADRPVAGLVLRMLARSRVRGTVSAPSGGALRDVRVLVAFGQPEQDGESETPWNELYRWQSATRVPVHSNGGFEADVPFAAPGRLLLRAVSLDHQQGDAKPVDLVEGQASYQVDIALSEGVAIEGRVMARGGVPVAGADVSVSPHHDETGSFDLDVAGAVEGGSPSISAVTDSSGGFAVAHLPPGRFDVRARARGFVGAQVVVETATSPTVNLELSPEMTIDGTVALADGSPVEGMQVDANEGSGGAPRVIGGFVQQGHSAVTDAKGTFHLGGLPDGRYSIAATVPWGAQLNVRAKTVEGIAAGSTDVKITVEPGGTISGHVVDGKRRPVAEVWISADVTPHDDGEDDTSDEWHNTVSKPDGTFVIVGLAGGPYTLHFSASDSGSGGFRPKTVDHVAVGTKDLEVMLDAGLAISGVVVDGDGRPVARMLLEAAPVADGENEGNVQTAWTDAQGKFTASGLAPGGHRMRVGRWGGENQGWIIEPPVTAEAGASGLRILASRGATITGVVVDERGDPVPKATVRATEAKAGADFSREAHTRSDGTYEVSGLPRTGSFDVTAEEPAHLDTKAADVAPGARNVKLVLPRGLEASGRLLDVTGKAMAHASVMFTIASEGRNQSVETDAEGRFTVRGLTDGAYDAQTFVQIPGGAGDWKPCGGLKGGDRNVELRVQ